MIKEPDFSGLNLILVDEVESTNNYATSLLASRKVEEGTVILTFRQTKGRGHGNNVWISEDFKNLTFSLILFPHFLAASRQFLLSQVVSLGLFDLLSSEFKEVAIKWPNDLLIDGRKVAGILVENSVSGTNIVSSVIGIGMNVNQLSFPDYPSPATSLAIQTSKEYQLNELLRKAIDHIMRWYVVLRDDHIETIQEEYLSHLFRIGKKSLFRKGDLLFEAQITGMDHYGQLILRRSSGEEEVCGFKSVEMVF
jgi:BirA family transcriptional regulator, biotin operon repressor / biotin---[acetyl-CoA-carboxylase] ligase